MSIWLAKDVAIADVGAEWKWKDDKPYTVYGKIQLSNCDLERMWGECGKTSYSKTFVEGLERSCSNYQAKNNYFLCVHVITAREENGPASAVRIHGFLWDKLNELGLRGFKLNLHVGFKATNNGIEQESKTLIAVIPVISDATTVGSFDATHEACIGSEEFREQKNVLFNDMLRFAASVNPNSTCNVSAVVNIFLSGEEYPSPTKFSIDQRILDSKIQSDVTIVASNEAELKCHKVFLAGFVKLAHSPVFAAIEALFETDMTESQTKKIEMPDISEDGVRAFLAYLYTWDTAAPLKNSQIALELLEAGHKYDISILEKEMKVIFLRQPPAWCDAEVGLRVFLFARNVDDCDDLKEKAVEVLKLKSEEMLQSKFYNEIIQEDAAGAAQAAFELFALIAVKNKKQGIST